MLVIAEFAGLETYSANSEVAVSSLQSLLLAPPLNLALLVSFGGLSHFFSRNWNILCEPHRVFFFC